MRLDYSTPQAAKTTDERISKELTPPQRLEFYQSVGVLAVRDLDQAARQNLSDISSLLLMAAKEGVASSKSSYETADTSAMSRAFMQERFGGKTPSQIVAHAQKEADTRQSEGMQAMETFWKLVNQYGQAAEKAGW